MLLITIHSLFGMVSDIIHVIHINGITMLNLNLWSKIYHYWKHHL